MDSGGAGILPSGMHAARGRPSTCASTLTLTPTHPPRLLPPAARRPADGYQQLRLWHTFHLDAPNTPAQVGRRPDAASSALLLPLLSPQLGSGGCTRLPPHAYRHTLRRDLSPCPQLTAAAHARPPPPLPPPAHAAVCVCGAAPAHPVVAGLHARRLLRLPAALHTHGCGGGCGGRAGVGGGDGRLQPAAAAAADALAPTTHHHPLPPPLCACPHALPGPPPPPHCAPPAPAATCRRRVHRAPHHQRHLHHGLPADWPRRYFLHLHVSSFDGTALHVGVLQSLSRGLNVRAHTHAPMLAAAAAAPPAGSSSGRSPRLCSTPLASASERAGACLPAN